MKVPFNKEYSSRSLSKKDLLLNPFQQFELWFQEALAFPVLEANAAVLATASKNGIPSSRSILIKEIDHGFIFYTNYQSRKGRDIEENPYGSLTFYWKELERQVTIDGLIEKVASEKSDEYFFSRTREKQIGSSISHQGKKIASRNELDQKHLEFEKEYENKEIPRPKFWGGYRLIPSIFIFWQGREHRLSDRFIYEKINGSWQISRLAP